MNDEARLLPRRLNPRPLRAMLYGLLPRSWVLCRARSRPGVLHLTFDDGPHPLHTPLLLDLLAAHGIKATFFVIGEHAQAQPELLMRMFEEGHALGNHSWSHPRFELAPAAVVREEIERCDALLASFDGRPQHELRTPEGVMAPQLLWRLLRMRRRVVYWSWDSRDYSRLEDQVLLDAARHWPPKSGDIVLLHDDAPRSLALLALLLPAWIAAGYTFEPFPVAASKRRRRLSFGAAA